MNRAPVLPDKTVLTPGELILTPGLTLTRALTLTLTLTLTQALAALTATDGSLPDPLDPGGERLWLAKLRRAYFL